MSAPLSPFDRIRPMLGNALSLYSVQGLQFLVPLISFPWLVRALGSDGYGLLNLAGAFGGYLQVVCDYGFHLSATSNLARVREDRVALSREVSSILFSKLLLAGFGTIGLLVLALVVPNFRNHSHLLVLACLASLATSLFPSWLFQGLERMKGMAAISAISKLLQLLLLLLLIHAPEHLPRALWINVGMAAASSFAAWVLALKHFPLTLLLPSFDNIRSTLRDGLEIFLSQAGAMLFANTNLLILGAYAPLSIVGSYAIAEKFIRVGIQLGAPLGTALYPRIARLIHVSRIEAGELLNWLCRWGGGVFALLSISMCLGAPICIHLISGHADIQAIAVAQILSPLPLTIFLDNLFGTQILLNLGYRRIFMMGTLSGGVLALSLQFLLVPRYSAYGAALALLTAELWVLGFFFLQSRQRFGSLNAPKIG